MANASGGAFKLPGVNISGVNLHFFRGDEPLCPETLRKLATERSKTDSDVADRQPRVYVDNYSNGIRHRVGKVIDEGELFAQNNPIGKALKELRTDPFKQFEVANSEVAEAAGDIYAREFAEYEWMTLNENSTGALSNNLQTILNGIPADGTVPSTNVILHRRIGRGKFGDVFLGTLRLEEKGDKSLEPREEQDRVRQESAESKPETAKATWNTYLSNKSNSEIESMKKEQLPQLPDLRVTRKVNTDEAASLHEPIPASNVGRRMLMKFGYTGGGLGKNRTGIVEPIVHAEVRKERDFAGLGHPIQPVAPHNNTFFNRHFLNYQKREPERNVAFTPRFGESAVASTSLSSLNQENQVVVGKRPTTNIRLQVAVRKARMPNFERFMEQLMDLDHVNIVRFMCACLEDPAKPLIVTEYMEMSLWEALHVRTIQMRDEDKLVIMEQMWRGLSYLHKMNVAHCDVKATNVLLRNVTEGGKGITAKVADYALAIVQDPSESSTFYVSEHFSPRYAAPEMLRLEPLNLIGLKAADVYAMAVTCFELSTEQKPFFGYTSEEKLLLRRRDYDFELRPSDWIPQPLEVHRFLERCWNRQAGERPTAQDVVVALENLIRDSADKTYWENAKNAATTRSPWLGTRSPALRTPFAFRTRRSAARRGTAIDRILKPLGLRRSWPLPTRGSTTPFPRRGSPAWRGLARMTTRPRGRIAQPSSNWRQPVSWQPGEVLTSHGQQPNQD